jgi:RHS repeat-associated protein
MKKHFIAILLYILSLGAFAQQTNTRNYIIKRTHKQSGANPDDISKVVTQVQYFDGLGRPIQTVTVGQSPSGHDFVEPIEYDAAGRIMKKYLPYVAGGNGAYQSNALSAAGSWYTANSAGLQAADLGRPYDETAFEPSPLSRVSGQRAPGDKSVISAIKYKVNTASEVKRYDYNPAANSIDFIGNYAAGSLLRKQFTDEQGNVTNEYTDMLGQMVCRQVIASAQATLSNYYIYDDLGLLRAVLQPNYQDNPSITGNAFTYDYDNRGRMIGKNVPGAGKTEYVYDQYDRLALSQDANQLKRGVWAFTKFDALDRPVITGEITSASTRADWSVIVDALTQHHEDRNNAVVAGYTLDKTAPKTAVESNILTITFYDDYTFSKSAYFAFDNLIVPSFNANVKGQVTGGRVRMLPGNVAQGGFLTNVIYYDAEYRPIQSTRDLYDFGAGHYERSTKVYKYDLSPVIDAEETIHWHSASEGYGVFRSFVYDHSDRLLDVYEQIGTSTDLVEALSVSYRYNALGSLQSKWFYNVKDNKYQLRTNHTYNIRGWLTDGKTVYKKDEGGPDKTFFGFGLTYANGNNYTNGNISQMQWMKKDDAAFTKGLSFSYDGANRLTGSTGLNGYVNTESGMTYDKNGNIKTLVRTGAAVDNLTYAYSANDNRLTSLTDGSGSNLGVKNGASSYGYDDNGNMTTDGNRSAAITYNYLNLPKTVTMNGKTQAYDYDAAGGKHKYVSDTLTLKYEGPFEYRQVGANNILYRVSLSEGQAKLKNGTAKFEYYLKDHLGNVRVVFDQLGVIKQQTDYYPFGLSVSGDPAGTTQAVRNGNNRYLFNGIERQPETGIYQARYRGLDPLIGRWMQVDPMAENGRRWSPYNYAFNNPMRFIDPDGMWPECCGANPSSLVLGKAQNAWNGIIRNASTAASSATAYLNSGSKAIYSALSPSDGIPFYSQNGQGGETRRSSYKTGEVVDIGGIMSAFEAVGADGSAFKLDGKGVIGKIISAFGFMKEAAGAGDMVGDAVNEIFGDVSIGLGKSTKNENKPKLKPGEFIKALDSTINANKANGYTNFNFGTSADSAFGLLNSSVGFGPVKTDTIKPKSN